MPTPSPFFDKDQAATYDQRSARLAPLRDTLLLLAAGILSELPDDARILCVGAGTGAEVFALARRFARWTFTAVEPSGAMLDVCRRRAEEEGIAERCTFHEGYLDSLPPSEGFHAATSILVSQFILRPEERWDFFRGIAARLLPGGILVNADLSTDLAGPDGARLLEVWARLQLGSPDPSPADLERFRTAYSRDVAVRPPEEIEELLRAGGFPDPVLFFQSLLIRGWFARRS